MISIRERHYFDKNQLTPDLLNILEKIKKKFALVSLQEDLKQIELQKSLKELISDRYSLENEVILCNSKIDYLESKIGCYGEYFNNKISSNKVQKKRLKSL